MMFDQDLPNSLWAEATCTAVYIQNRCSHVILEDKTPEEAFTEEKPEIGHLRVFGCPVYVHVLKEKRTKMEPSGKKGIFVGYTETSKAYRMYVPGQRHIFRESKRLQRFAGYVAQMAQISIAKPTSYEDAARQQVWKDATMEEYQSIMKSDVWDVVPRPKGKLVVTTKWLFKIKHASDGSIEK